MINSNFKIVFSYHAQIELQQAVKWYNTQKKGLGGELKKEAKRTLGEIILNPTHASKKYDSTHVVACKTFPFTIHYEIDLKIKTIRVISFFHTKRNPNWL
jgi:hypothetical protein